MKGPLPPASTAVPSTSLGGTSLLRPLAADRMRSGRTALDHGFSDRIKSSTYLLTDVQDRDYCWGVSKSSMILVDDCPA